MRGSDNIIHHIDKSIAAKDKKKRGCHQSLTDRFSVHNGNFYLPDEKTGTEKKNNCQTRSNNNCKCTPVKAIDCHDGDLKCHKKQDHIF